MAIRDSETAWNALALSAERNRKRADKAEQRARKAEAELRAAYLREADLKWNIVSCVVCLNKAKRHTDGTIPRNSMCTEIEEVLRVVRERFGITGKESTCR